MPSDGTTEKGTSIDPIWPKLEALERLSSIRTKSFRLPSFVAFEADEWEKNPQHVLATIKEASLGPVLAVRSCAAFEDAAVKEPPGFFESVLGVDAADSNALGDAFLRVCRSYSRRTAGAGLRNKVLVQTQVVNPAISGVCRADRDPGEYLEVEYDDTLARTDSVTLGLKAQRVYLSPCYNALTRRWRPIHRAVGVIRRYFKPPFFLEFGQDSTGRLHVFQVRSDRRSQVSRNGRPPTCRELKAVGNSVRQWGPLSVMADWNPAEILGREPDPLDVSLYDELLMSGAWARGRASVGWRVAQDSHLMVEIGGRPYVKLRASLWTLLPSSLPLSLAGSLVEDRLRMLEECPELHDKVEFRVMWSAFAFDETTTRAHLRDRGFSASDITNLFRGLKQVTKKTLVEAPGLLARDMEGLGMLQRARRHLATINSESSPVELALEIRKALKICRDYGAVPFSRQARIAFSFKYIINHLVESGAIAPDIVWEWETGLNTVARRLSRDLGRVGAGTLSRSSFDRRYGHLRPRTYSLGSLRYDERLEYVSHVPSSRPKRCATPPQVRRLAEILKSIKVTRLSQADFWKRAAKAIRAREDIKFAFTALLSDVLRALAMIAAWSESDRATLQRLPIGTLLAIMESSSAWRDFGSSVRSAANTGSLSPRLRLSDVIFGVLDLHVVRQLESKPTFVGGVKAEGAPRVVSGDASLQLDLARAVAAIEAPDPGFDWVFAHPLSALITAYGGEFSHMGVRCAEFGIPAVLGCGPKLFEAACAARLVEVNPIAGEVWADGQRLYPP